MGRRRKASTSTVATVDNVRFSWVKEGAILKPMPESLHYDEAPTFVLTDAIIYERDGKTIGNPLFVDNVGPMIIRGKLEIGDDPEVLERLIKPNTKPTYMEISDSDRYSIGYGELALWVSGGAGWYEIRPAPAYEATYLEICEQITLYYEALNVYDDYEKQCGKGRKKKTKRSPPAPPSLEDVFFRYAVGAGDGVTLDEARSRYMKWAPFLASHFPKEADVIWEGTQFAKWIQEQAAKGPKDGIPRSDVPKPFPRYRRAAQVLEDSEDYSDAASDRSKAKHPAKINKRGGVQDTEMSDLVTPRLSGLPIRKGKDRTWVESPVPLPSKYQLVAQSTAPAPPPSTVPASPVDTLLEVLQEIASDELKPGIDPMKVGAMRVHNRLWVKCRVSVYKSAQEITAFYSKELLPRLGPEWKPTAFYHWLKEVSQKPVQLVYLTPEKIPSQMVRRNTKAKPVSQTTLASKTPSSSRPASVDPRGKSRASTSQTHFDDSEEEVYSAGRGRRSGKNAGLRPRSSKKRPASEMDLDDEAASGWRGTKSAKTSHAVGEGDSDMTDASNNESASQTDVEESDIIGFQLPPPEGSIKIVVHAERIPTMSPTGPNGTWTCEEEGCTYVVAAAEEQEGQELIQAHFRNHEAQAERMNLARKESRGHMPINHLLDKIQALGKKVIEKRTGTLNGEPLPAPVKRRLLA